MTMSTVSVLGPRTCAGAGDDTVDSLTIWVHPDDHLHGSTQSKHFYLTSPLSVMANDQYQTEAQDDTIRPLQDA